MGTRPQGKMAEPGLVAANILLIPLMKRCAGKYHDEATRQQAKAEAAVKEANQKLYKAKADRQCSMCRKMGGKHDEPLTALRRKEKGPQGQPAGTIATSPNEVDQILRKTLGKIYQGNAANGEGKAQRYMEKHAKFIFKAKNASMEDLTAEDLKETAACTGRRLCRWIRSVGTRGHEASVQQGLRGTS